MARLVRTTLRGVSLLAVTTVTLACVSCCSAPDRVPVDDPVADPKVPADIVLPFDAYQVPPEAQRLENDAYRELVRRCAADHGVALTMPPAEIPVDSNARRYGLFDAERARTHGYLGQTLFLDSVRAGEWRPSATQKAVLTGESVPGSQVDVPEGGCARQAETTLGLPDSTMADVEAAGLSTIDRAASDPEVLAAERRWSRCLAEQGLSFTRTFDPSNHRWPQPRGSAQEVRTATADVRCKQSTSLVAAWLNAESRAQRQVIADDPGAFSALRSWRDARLAKARAVLSEAAR
ncbi:hypothetical protein GCM10009867_06550 [Pedococcus aerophilus]|uniref:Secreted protein n=1 Tax=Pedococcus aerophilus TaxID=436356 RepID=A0ABN3UFU9_9MICO